MKVRELSDIFICFAVKSLENAERNISVIINSIIPLKRSIYMGDTRRRLTNSPIFQHTIGLRKICMYLNEVSSSKVKFCVSYAVWEVQEGVRLKPLHVIFRLIGV